MSQIVEADMAQIIPLQQLTEVGADTSRIENIAHRIHKDITVKLLVVAISADTLVFLLLLF